MSAEIDLIKSEAPEPTTSIRSKKRKTAMSTDNIIIESEPMEPTTASDPSSKKRKSAIDEIEVDLSLPEPPSKKARRLLKKGKPLPAKPQSDDEEDEDAAKDKATDGGEKKKKERSPYGVWVGNLPFSVTKAELRKWLVDNSGGAISEEGITRVHMPTTISTTRVLGKDQKKTVNKGFAYVDFAAFEASVAAAALSEQDLTGRKLLIKDSKNFEGRPKKEEPADAADGEVKDNEAKSGKQDGDGKAGSKRKATKVFVGNLAFNSNEDELWEHFEKCGRIRWVKVATFEDTGKCKGYGWVNFEEPEAAEWAAKGFVKIKETVEKVEDFMDEGKTRPAGEGADDEAEEKGSAPSGEKSQLVRRIKTRKWWVNELHGRTLKIELAEDDQVRYKKRF
jgi:RNA recognition motif-containing protein